MTSPESRSRSPWRARLLPLARTEADVRFVIGRAPGSAFADEVLRRVEPDAMYLEELERSGARRLTTGLLGRFFSMRV